MKLIATTRLTYAGWNLRAGDPFEATEKDGKLLKAIRKAKDAPPPPIMRRQVVLQAAAAPTVYAASSLDAEIASALAAPLDVPASTTEIPFPSDDVKPKRQYKRKDMRAESAE